MTFENTNLPTKKRIEGLVFFRHSLLRNYHAFISLAPNDKAGHILMCFSYLMYGNIFEKISH